MIGCWAMDKPELYWFPQPYAKFTAVRLMPSLSAINSDPSLLNNDVRWLPGDELAITSFIKYPTPAATY